MYSIPVGEQESIRIDGFEFLKLYVIEQKITLALRGDELVFQLTAYLRAFACLGVAGGLPPEKSHDGKEGGSIPRRLIL